MTTLNSTSTDLDSLKQTIWAGNRINPTEAHLLFRLSLAELGALAHHRRLLAKKDHYHGEGARTVTYHIDRNINYTNVCNVHCQFCAFYRTEKDADAYVISFEDLDKKIEETIELGGKQILMQGGHHPKLTLQWYLDLLSHIKSKYPQINIHAFSPSEFIHFERVFGLPVEEIIRQFAQAGLGSIPGGGAEILVDRVRKKLSPAKARTNDWMRVMDTAHASGLSTSATMMFGHIETLEERIEHLDVFRRQQDKTHGFTAFIAWTYQAENTKLHGEMTGPEDYLKTLAIARIYLDNFANIQSSWVTQGPQVAQVALLYGANDMGSIMIEENVVSQAGARFKMSLAEMRYLIQSLGFIPRERDNWYNLVDAQPVLSLASA